MPLSVEQQKELILGAIGDPDGVAGGLLDLLFTKHDDITPLKLRALYVQRDAVYTLMGSVREKVSFADKNRRVELHQKFTHLQSMYELTLSDIAAFNATRARGGQGAYKADQITTIVPVPAEGWELEASGHVYSGTPYERQRRP